MIRKAAIEDAASIHQLVNSFARRGEMLARSLSEIYENIREYYVAIERGKVVGVTGLHVNWEDLAEIKSVAVAAGHRGKGLGRQLVEACIQEGLGLGIRKFYLLTYIPAYFRSLGFKPIDRNTLPHKVWNECLKCPTFPNCTEKAMMMRLTSTTKVTKSRTR